MQYQDSVGEGNEKGGEENGKQCKEKCHLHKKTSLATWPMQNTCGLALQKHQTLGHSTERGWGGNLHAGFIPSPIFRCSICPMGS